LLDDAEFLDRLVHARTAPYARGIDQDVFAVIALEGHRDTVTGCARLVEDDQPILAEQPVDERRLADVWTPDDRDAQFFVIRLALLRLFGLDVELIQDRFNERTDVIAVRSRYRMRFTDA
jgi:hypothetical protein